MTCCCCCKVLSSLPHAAPHWTPCTFFQGWESRLTSLGPGTSAEYESCVVRQAEWVYGEVNNLLDRSCLCLPHIYQAAQLSLGCGPAAACAGDHIH